MENNIVNELYDNDSLKVMRLADEARLPGKNRMEEIRNYTKVSGIKRIGIAHCVAVQKEANVLKEFLASSGLEVHAIDCKCGKIPNSEILGREAAGFSCNPAGQAKFLSENDTELNISMGLCVGHDMVFNQKSHALVTTFIVKDRQFKHNPVEVFRNKD
ncbi:MAG: DUF1847 domain-containing protein [Bacteroidota bacterium]|nr:DUF1847 domain-containing protein [Bacteroidota bacterium]